MLGDGRSRGQAGRLDAGHVDEAFDFGRADDEVVAVADRAQARELGDGVALGDGGADAPDKAEYSVKNPELRKLWFKANELKESFKKISFVNVRRTNPFIETADELVNKTSISSAE